MSALCVECDAPLDLPAVEDEEAVGEDTLPLEAQRTRPIQDERTLVMPPQPTPAEEPAAPAPPYPARAPSRAASPVFAGVIAALVVLAIGVPLVLLIMRIGQPPPSNAPVVADAVLDASAVAEVTREKYVQSVRELWPVLTNALDQYASAVESGDLDDVARVAGEQRMMIDRLLLDARKLRPPEALLGTHHKLLSGLERASAMLDHAVTVAANPTDEDSALRAVELIYGDCEAAQKDLALPQGAIGDLELDGAARAFVATDSLAQMAAAAREKAADEARLGGPRPVEGYGYESYDDITPEPSPSGVPEEELLPESRYRELTADDVADMTRRQLFVARMEIHARHGRVFESRPLQRYFERWSWYKPDPNYTDELLSDVERRNVDFLRGQEESAPD